MGRKMRSRRSKWPDVERMRSAFASAVQDSSGAHMTPFGGSHRYPEEVLSVGSRLYDQAVDRCET